MLKGFLICSTLLAFAVPAAGQNPAATPAPAQIPGGGDSTLHVLRPVIHAEQDQAELCLEFDHALDMPAKGGGGSNRSSIGLTLERDGKALAVTAKTTSIDGRELCLPNLDHRKTYRLTLNSLSSPDGLKLDKPYILSATIPARHPVLAVLNSTANNGLMRWNEADPVLRAVNIEHARLELYRVAEPTQMADAWSQRLQTTLAPSESATYAKAHGTLVWQGEMSLPDSKDQRVEMPVPLAKEAGKQPPGLYLLVASAPDIESDKPAADGKAVLAPTAAAWLLRSGLHIRGFSTAEGIYALADAGAAGTILAPVKDVRFMLLDHAEQIVAERRSDPSGVALLSPADKTKTATTLMGLTEAGDADFTDATQLAAGPVLPASEASLATAKPAYAPGEMIDLTLTARDNHGHPLAVPNSSLQVQRPDRSVFTVLTLTTASGHVSLTAPAASGLWHLVWRQADGVTLAEIAVPISVNPQAPHIELAADRSFVNEDGEATITVRSIGLDGKPQPFIGGQLISRWDVPDHVFAGWDDYRFGGGDTNGAGENGSAAHAPLGFVTDSKGVAFLHLKLTPPGGYSSLHAARFSVTPDPSSGVVEVVPLTVPVKPGDFIVGVRPVAQYGRFAENSLARFDVVALDGDGKRRQADNLTYQIYQQGRSFDWHQQDGRWDYKPQEQQRRIGGGSLQVSADNVKRIEFPVTAGSYRLEVTDANGDLRTRVDFSAGWGLAKSEPVLPARLELKPAAAYLQTGQETLVHFNLPKAAVVTALVADDKLRQVQHMAKAAGDNTLSLTPQGDWGNRVGLWVTTRSDDSSDDQIQAAGQLMMPVGPPVAASVAPVAATPPEPPASRPLRKDDNGFAATHDLHTVSNSLIAPQRSYAPLAEKNRLRDNQMVFTGAEPVAGLPELLTAALNQTSFTTPELAGMLEALRTWHNTIIAAGLLTEAEYSTRQHEAAARLLARQQPDGGFAAMPGDASALDATGAALTALAGFTGNGDEIKASADAAADWLRRQLDNTWFDEKDRPLRAAAYAGLAAAGRLDAASLHYFADTSVAKNLPPLAAAQLATAFARINDRDQSQYWLNLAHSGLTAVQADGLNSGLLPLLMAHPSFDPHEALAALQKLVTASPVPLAVTDALRAMASLQMRAGTWRLGSAKGESSLQGVFVTPWPSSMATPVLRNLSDRPLYAATAQIVKKPAVAGNVTRRFYRLDGSLLKEGKLEHGAVYVVALEGSWKTLPADLIQLMLHDAVGPGLKPVGCALAAPDSDDFLNWLHGLTLSRTRACERNGDTLDALIERGDGKTSEWRIAYLAQAAVASGSYDIAPATVRLLGLPGAAQQGGAVRIIVR